MENTPYFHQVLADHYSQRVATVVKQGLRYSTLYFFLRNSMRYHRRLCSGVVCKEVEQFRYEIKED